MRLLEKNRDMRPATGRVLMQEVEKLERELAPVKTRVVSGEELDRYNQGGGGAAPPWPPSPPAPHPQPGPLRPPDLPKVAPQPAPRPHPQEVVPPRPQPKESRWGLWVAIIVLIVGIAGAGIYFATRPSTPTATVTVVLSADPTTIEKGNPATLRWTAQNATDLDVEPGVGKVQADGSTTVSPEESTLYTLTA